MHYAPGWFFYVLSILALAVFAAGAYQLVHLALLGREPEPPGRGARAWVRRFARAVFVQDQIAGAGPLARLAHLGISYGFAGLLLLTSLQFVLKWTATSPGAREFFTAGAGAAAMAAWGDFFGLLLLAGLVLALVRRYVVRPKHLDTLSEDALAVWLLLAVVVTGFGCEFARLAARPGSPDAKWSVFGPVMDLFGPFSAHFGPILDLLFWVHAILSLAFIALIPFTKPRHLFTSPAVFASVTSQDAYTRGSSPEAVGRRPAAPQPQPSSLRPQASSLQPQASSLTFSHLTRTQVLSLFACARCGQCVAWCPVYEFDPREDITPRAKLAAIRDVLVAQESPLARLIPKDSFLGRLLFPRAAPEDLAAAARALYECSTCRQCHFVCPSGIDTVELYEALRRVLVDAGLGPLPNHANLLKSTQAYDNPWQQPRSHRDRWAKTAKKEGRIQSLPPMLKPGKKPSAPGEGDAP